MALLGMGLIRRSRGGMGPENGDAVPWMDAYRGVIGRCDEASESADYLSSCFFRKAYICRGDDEADRRVRGGRDEEYYGFYESVMSECGLANDNMGEPNRTWAGRAMDGGLPRYVLSSQKHVDWKSLHPRLSKLCEVHAKQTSQETLCYIETLQNCRGDHSDEFLDRVMMECGLNPSGVLGVGQPNPDHLDRALDKAVRDYLRLPSDQRVAFRLFLIYRGITNLDERAINAALERNLDEALREYISQPKASRPPLSEFLLARDIDATPEQVMAAIKRVKPDGGRQGDR